MKSDSCIEFTLGGGISRRFDMGFFGDEMDARSKAAITELKACSSSSFHVAYNHQNQVVGLNGVNFDVGDVRGISSNLPSGSLLIDATSVGFIELLVLLRVCKQRACSNVAVLYLEPKSYTRGIGMRSFGSRDFDLSDLFEDYFSVPGSVVLFDDLSRIHVACLLGYEGSRFGQLIEQVGVSGERLSVVFGVPAFQAGWEMNSFANNLGVLWENRGQSISYCPADDPFSAYRQLQRLRETLENGVELVVCPIGTKPHALGAALFCVEHPEVGLIYDSPTKRSGRSSNVGTAHLFPLDFRCPLSH